jgi:predicted nuclease of predicted toxin-antitoxin system
VFVVIGDRASGMTYQEVLEDFPYLNQEDIFASLAYGCRPRTTDPPDSSMKLIFDRILSPKLVYHLAELFSNSKHVYQLGLDQVEDQQVWQYAKANDFTIFTKDGDYNDLLILLCFPPKIIWIRRGNCSTNEIEDILRMHYLDIQDLTNTESLGLLTLY